MHVISHSTVLSSNFGSFPEAFLLILIITSLIRFMSRFFVFNCTSKVTINICQTSSYCRVVTRIIASTGPITRYLNLKALNCCECSVKTVLKRIFGE